MDRQRIYRRIAAGLLGVAGIVLIVTPYLLSAPNPIGLVIGVACVLMGLGVEVGRMRTVPLVWSAIGLGASVIWAVLALDGFGTGLHWWDDVLEAVVLATLFAGALMSLLLAKGQVAEP